MIKLRKIETRLAELRIDNDLKQKDIAEQFNIKRSTYSMWESKNDIFPLKRLIDLCNYFDVSLDYIFSLTDTKQYKPNKKDKQILEEVTNKIMENIIELAK